MSELVSIIMPAYNAEKFISESIESVRKQTYQNWELLIVDDCSTDTTKTIVKKLSEVDSRIVYIPLLKNSGAAIARKTGIEASKGRFIAFLDSDDLWIPEKLEKQIAFMLKNKKTFTCTIYGKITENGTVTDRVVNDKNISDYKSLLKNCPGNSTVIYDAHKLGKITPVNIRKRNDYVLWLSVIKKSKNICCIQELLGYHREREGSISSNKMSLMKYHWQIYRNIEKINPFYSLYLVGYWCFKGVIRIISNKSKKLTK